MRHKPNSASVSPSDTPRREEGFTLTEVIVAMLLAVILLVALTLSIGVALRSTRQNRIHRQATVLAIEHLEFARSVGWTELAISEPVRGWDPRILHPSDTKVIGATMDLANDESLVKDFSNGLIEVYADTTLDGITFEVTTYVTDVEPGLRRVIVFVDWTYADVAREHFTMSLISEVSAS